MRLLVILAVLAPLAALPQALWVADVHLDGFGEAESVAVDASGNTYLTGVSYDTLAGTDMFTVKIDPYGSPLWTARYDGPAHMVDSGHAVAVDGNGNVYVTGASYGAGGQNTDVCTIKYDADGNQVWVRLYDGAAHGDDVGRHIVLGAAGEVYVAGETGGGSQKGPDYCVLRYDPDGNLQWARTYDGPAHLTDSVSAAALDAGGDLIVTGCSEGIGTDTDFCTIKFSPAGDVLWLRRYDGPAHEVDCARALALGAGAEVVVTGESFGGKANRYDYCTIEYDADGNLLWVQRYDGAAHGDDVPWAVGVDTAMNVFVTGESFRGGPSDFDFCTIKYDPAGNLLWQRTYDGPGHRADVANALAIDAAGNVCITGYSDGGQKTGYDVCSTKYDTDGDPLWVRRYDGEGHGDDRPAAMVLDAAGAMCVAGYVTTLLDTPDPLAIKYPSLAVLSGSIDLQGLNPMGSPSSVLEFRTPGTTTAVYTAPVSFDNGPIFVLTGLPAGTYDVACKFPNWLRKVATGVRIGGGSDTILNFALPNGDANGDNAVNLVDISTVLSDFGKKGAPPMEGDLNWDRNVGLADLSLILSNYNMRGDD